MAAETSQRAAFRQANTGGGLGHFGLRFDRFLAVWSDPDGAPSGERQRDYKLTIQRFVSEFNAAAAPGQQRLDARHRMLDRVGGEQRDFKTAWRYVSGLGATHPIENGFTFDRSIGVPIVSGSSVKGLVRAAADLDSGSQADRDRLLGPESAREDEAAAGSLVFLDAYPAHWPRLAVDIVNCHHPAYYEQLERRQQASAPAHPVDWENPNPVYFLTVDRGVTFRFRIAPRRHDRTDLALAWEWLELGLEWLGIGAKTAAGYGEMHPVSR